jgi:hypothetical protein
MTGPVTGSGDGTDERAEVEQSGGDAAAERAARRPSPTSRARRIGGISRPAGGRATDDAAAEAQEAAPTAPGSPAVTLGKAPAVPAQDAEHVDGDVVGHATGDADLDVDGNVVGDPGPADSPGATVAGSPRAAVAVPAWLRWLPAAALGAAALVMLVFFAVTAHGVWWGRPSANTVRDQVLSAAKSCMVATNSWNYKTLAADEAKGAQCTTGTRTTEYRNGMEKVVAKYAAKLQASQVAQVSTAGVSGVSSDGRSWTVLVVGQLDIRQKSNTKGSTDPFAALVRMDKVGGRWLMAQLQEVSGPSS